MAGIITHNDGCCREKSERNLTPWYRTNFMGNEAGIMRFALEVVNALSEARSQLGREINPVIMTAEEFVAQQEKEDRFVARVLDEPKIFVMGKADDLAKLAEHRTAG